MQMTMREAKARFSEAANAAASGEDVVITKHGLPFIKIVPAEPSGGLDFNRLEAVRAELGVADNNADWFDDFISNPEASRRVLGLED
jgi:prevent-host-death family protein